jgi:hypothetical protein
VGPLLLTAFLSSGLALIAGWAVVRAELRSVGFDPASRQAHSGSGRPRLGARVMLSTLQAMLALWTLGAIAGWVVFQPHTTELSEGAARAFVFFRRMTVAGCLAFVPFSLVTLAFAVRSIWQEQDDGRGVAPMAAAAMYLVALFVLYANPGFWQAG